MGFFLCLALGIFILGTVRFLMGRFLCVIYIFVFAIVDFIPGLFDILPPRSKVYFQNYDEKAPEYKLAI
jgi:hypothetical protein